LVAGVASLDFRSTYYGYGRHQVVVMNSPNGPENIAEFYYDMFIIFFLYVVTLCTFKLSILALWVRLFYVCTTFCRICYGVGVGVILWTLLALFIHLFRCSPISASWDNQGTCFMTYTAFNFMLSIPTIVSSFIILVLPLPLVMRLKLSLSKRLALFAVFLLGSGDLTVSIVRLYEATQYNFLDYTCKFSPTSDGWFADMIDIGRGERPCRRCLHAKARPLACFHCRSDG
jgi:hypothetical protein